MMKHWFFSPGYGMDLGTANTVVYVANKGIILNEPSVVAMKYTGNQSLPYKVGNDAKRMLGKTPGSIIAFRPLKDGVIADFKGAEAMIKMFINKVVTSKSLIGPRIVVCVPSGSTPVERKAIQESAEGVGPRKVQLIEEPMAAAIGSGLPVTEPTGCMVVDIGGGTTEVAVIALGGVVCAKSARVGGDAMDEAIVNYIRNNYNLLIGESTAERIKKTIGSAIKPEKSDDAIMTIKGRSLITGTPCEITMSESQIAESLEETVIKIVAAIQSVLEQTPPELCSDIAEHGIMLSGGGALLKGLDEVVSKHVKLRVKIAKTPLSCVANGIGIVLEDLETLEHVLFEQD